MTFLLMLLISLSIIFLWLNHPMSMGLILILQAIIIAMITGKMMNSFMLAYIFIIIVLSGVLVLFIYMASMASNEMFQTSFKLTMTFFISNLSIYIITDKMMMTDLFIISKNTKNTIIIMNKMFNSYTNMITIMLMIYLLLTMIIISNIANSSEGPLRMKYV